MGVMCARHGVEERVGEEQTTSVHSVARFNRMVVRGVGALNMLFRLLVVALCCMRVCVILQFLPLLQDLSNFIRRAGRLCVNMVHQVLLSAPQYTVSCAQSYHARRSHEFSFCFTQ